MQFQYHKSNFLLTILCWGIFSGSCSSAQLEKWPKLVSAVKPDKEIEHQVKKLLMTMTLEEKVAQMTQAEIQSISPDEVRTFRLGSILNGGGSFPGNNKFAKISDWVKLADTYYHASMDTSSGRKAIPIMWGTDAVHGHNNVIGATLFPHNIGLGATHNSKLMEKIGNATAKEVLATGIDWIFAPTVAVVRNDRWGRSYEGYSEDPQIVKSFSQAMVQGLQGKKRTILNKDHVISTVKHFIGDGGTTDGVDQGNNTANEQQLYNIHAQGYVSGLAAGAQTVMASFNSWSGEKVHGNHYLLTEVLKKKMGFDGFVIGDWNGHGQVKGCRNDSCPQAINAGVDMIMVPQDWKNFISNTVSQVKSGEISLQRIDDAVTRILRVKMRAGLFTMGMPSQRTHAGNVSLIGAPEHRKWARQAVRESLVLLKNKKSLLPLPAKSKILITGRGADNIGQQSGGWTISWQGTGNSNSDFPNGSSIYDGISKAAKAAGGEVELSSNGEFSQKPDVAIVVFGEAPYAEGQGDISDFNYGAKYTEDIKLLKKLKAQKIPVVTVFLTGRPLWVNPEMNASDAFVVAWLPGSEGEGVADVILGKKNGKPRFDFKGRLSFSWPMTAAPMELNIGQKDYSPLFSFGYGLTYRDIDKLGDNLSEVPFPSGDDENAPQNRIQIYSGQTLAPFASYVGDKDNWKVELPSGRGATSSGSVKVKAIDRNTQEDSRQITFNGETPSNFFVESATPVNMTEFSDNRGVLKIDLRVEKSAESPVYLLMGCQDGGCSQKIDISKSLASFSLGEWTSLTVDLKCFHDLGTNFSQIFTPLSLFTSGPLTFSISKIEIQKATSEREHIKCP